MCDKSNVGKIVNEVKDAALSIFNNSLRKVILYGSYARGDNTKYSDIDICLLVDKTAEELVKYRHDIYKLSNKLTLEDDDCTMVSIDINDTETFNKWSGCLPYFANIISEGVVYYES